MKQFALFCVDIFRHWWALMSCAAFTAVSFWSGLKNKGGLFTVVSTAVLAVVLFFVALYQTWQTQQHRLQSVQDDLAAANLRLVEERRDSKERIMQIKQAGRAAVTFRDWEQLGEQLASACRSMRADYQQTEGRRTWHIAGGFNTPCRALLVKAGSMLISSTKVVAQLPAEIVAEVDPLVRWCELLHAQGYSTSDMYGWEDLPEGKKLYHFLGSVKSLPESSAALCSILSAKEM